MSINLKALERVLRAADRLLSKVEGQLHDEVLLKDIRRMILQVDHCEIAVAFERIDLNSLSLSISDLLCWHAGFAAARDGSNPLGVHELREFNIKIKVALED